MPRSCVTTDVNVRSLAVAGGVALTTALLVGVAVVEVVRVDPGAGILGVGLGLLCGAVAFAAVASRRHEALAPVGLVEAAAAFGWTILAVLALSYVNAPGVRSLDATAIATVATAVGAAVGLVVRLRGRRRANRTEKPT